MNKTIKGILFDKDGTLIDFEATWLPAYREAVRRISRRARNPALEDLLLIEGGWDAGSGRWRPGSLLASGSNQEISEFWAGFCPNLDPEEVFHIVTETFFAHASAAPKTVKSVPQLIPRLHEQGYILGIATMDDEATAKRTVRSLEFTGYFDFVCGADSGFGVKPGPGMVEAFCARTGIPSSNVMMVGDSPHDIHMGQAASVGLTVGVLSGAHSFEDLAPLADKVINSVASIPELLC